MPDKRNIPAIWNLLGALVLAVVLVVLVWKIGLPGGDRVDDRLPAQWDNLTRQKVDSIRYAVEHHIRGGELAKARAILEPHLRRFPNDPKGPYFLAMLLLAEDTATNKPKAFAAIERYLKMEGTQHAPFFEAAVLADDLGHGEAAATLMRRARELAPKEARYAMYLGQLTIKQGNKPEGARLLQEATKLDHGLVRAFQILATLAEENDQPDVAIAWINRALMSAKEQEDDDEYVSSALIKARMFITRNDPGQARTILLLLKPVHQKRPAVARLLADCYTRLNRPGPAATIWWGLADDFPENAEYAARAGLSYLDAGDVDSARRFAERARNIDKTDARTMELTRRLADKPSKNN